MYAQLLYILNDRWKLRHPSVSGIIDNCVLTLIINELEIDYT